MDVQMQDYITTRYAGAYAGLEHIPVGVDPAAVLGGDGARVRARHDLGDAPLVLSIGHVIPLRDRVALVEAMPKVLRRHPRARVLVVGRVYYDVFLERARELGVSHAVLAVGAVARADVPDYLAAADVEAHDLQGYGLGTASLESMAAGVPVVAAVRPDNFPGVRLVSGQDLVLVPVGDVQALAAAVVELLGDPGRRAGIGGVRAAAGPRAVLPRRGAGPAPRGAGPDGHPHDGPLTVRPGARVILPPCVPPAARRRPPGGWAGCRRARRRRPRPPGEGDEAVQLGGQRLAVRSPAAGSR